MNRTLEDRLAAWSTVGTHLEPFRVAPAHNPEGGLVLLGTLRPRLAFAKRADAEKAAQEWSRGARLDEIQWFGNLDVRTWPNEWFGGLLGGVEDEYEVWDRVLDAGRSYLYGTSRTVKDMVRRAIRMTFGMCLVVRRAWMNPWEEFRFSVGSGRYRNRTRKYRVRRRGEYVEIELPYHGWGGEKSWVTRDLKRMVLVNVD